MSAIHGATDGTVDDPEAAALLDAFTDAARVLVPFATMYLGPAVAVILKDQDGSTRDPAARDRQILMLAFNKLVIEAGTLPAPATAYAPHSTAFVVDPQTRMGNALDLTYVLGALRGLTAWAAAGPAPANDANRAAAAAEADRTATASAALTAAPAAARSTRDLRMAARADGYARGTGGSRLAARTRGSGGGGCGCRGGGTATATLASSTSSLSSASSASSVFATRTAARRAARKPDCRDPRPHCDCGMSCGGRGCGCNGRTSCTDCIPRGASAGDRCACGTCPPRPPEACDPWTPSCETRNRLRRCLKDILCDLLLCLETAVCRNGTLDAAALKQWRAHLVKCFADLFCRALRCLREALCPPPEVCEPPALPAATDCLPCSYAVEDPR
jgi:hypothetical protein